MRDLAIVVALFGAAALLFLVIIPVMVIMPYDAFKSRRRRQNMRRQENLYILNRRVRQSFREVREII